MGCTSYEQEKLAAFEDLSKEFDENSRAEHGKYAAQLASMSASLNEYQQQLQQTRNLLSSVQEQRDELEVCRFFQ